MNAETKGETMQSTSRSVGEMASRATDQLEASFNRGKEKLSEMQALVTEKTRAYARTTDEFVHENPWKAIGVAAGIGFVIGLLIRRR